MKRIMVTIPKKPTDKWVVSFNQSARKRTTATMAFGWVKRYLLRACPLKDKIEIVIKVGRQTVNESLPSLDARYLIYTAACFLEDYLSETLLLKEARDWTKYGS